MSDHEAKVAEGADTFKAESPEVKPSITDLDTKDSAAAATAESAKAEDDKPAETEKTDATADKAEADSKPEEVNGKEDGNVTVSVRHPPKNMLGVKRPDRNQRDDRKQNKFDPSVMEDSSDPKTIRTQVHFYFSDSNLLTDKFLSDLTGLSENKPVSLATLCSFKRMRRFKPYSAVVDALKDSTFLDVEGDEGAETVKRKKAYDPSTSKNSKIDERSIYVKGFGGEEPSTQFDVEAFFSQYGEFNSVRLRRADRGGFKGSVFVEWADKETAEKFMALEPKPQWKEHDLLILWKLNYMDEKNKLIRSGEIAAKPYKNNYGSHRGRGDRNRDRSDRGRDGDFDKDDWKSRKEYDQKNGYNGRDRDRRGGGGRNQRGRGRGGNNRGRGGRDQGGERRNRGDEMPRINVGSASAATKAPETKEANGSPSTNGKRVRDDDANDAPPAKKVDTKEAGTEAT
ncbi:La domain-containing protein [Xylariales sp. AK1849]|nr:La domain-containing protein [Xylariales sp. AK1849]